PTPATYPLSLHDALPISIAYTRFVLDRGLAGDRLDLEIALAPCMIGYAEIAAERMADPATRHDGNPYRDWLAMYAGDEYQALARDRKSTRLNSSHVSISY